MDALGITGWLVEILTTEVTLGPGRLPSVFPSGCEGKLGVALESLQGRRDLT